MIGAHWYTVSQSGLRGGVINYRGGGGYTMGGVCVGGGGGTKWEVCVSGVGGGRS